MPIGIVVSEFSVFDIKLLVDSYSLDAEPEEVSFDEEALDKV